MKTQNLISVIALVSAIAGATVAVEARYLNVEEGVELKKEIADNTLLVLYADLARIESQIASFLPGSAPAHLLARQRQLCIQIRNKGGSC